MRFDFRRVRESPSAGEVDKVHIAHTNESLRRILNARIRIQTHLPSYSLRSWSKTAQQSGAGLRIAEGRIGGVSDERCILRHPPQSEEPTARSGGGNDWYCERC